MKFERVWNSYNVRKACIDCEWYTEGDNEAYRRMLMFVESHKPTDRNIERVANDIYNHSEKSGRTIESVAFKLAFDVVKLLLIEKD